MKTTLMMSIRSFVHFTGNMGTEAIKYINVTIELPDVFNTDEPEYCTGRLNVPTEMIPELIKLLQTAHEAQDFSLTKEIEVTT